MFKAILAAALLWAAPAFAADTVLLTTANSVTFRGTVDGPSITKVQLALMDQVLTRGKADYPIYLIMDSPGGSIIAGQAFIEFAKSIRNLKTISIFAASMASGIVEALPGERLVLTTGVMMFHRAQGSFQGYFEVGEVESELKLFQEIVLDLENTNASRLSIDLKTYKEKVAIEWWMFGKGAITDHAADRVVSLTCSPELIAATDLVTQDNGLFAISALFSKCPLFRAPIKTQEEN